MSSSPQIAAKKRRQAIWAAVGAILLAAGWYFGIGDHTPSRQDAERFLKWGLDDADGFVGFHENGATTLITAGLVKGIDNVECYKDTSGRKWFVRHQPSSRTYDCIYRLAGSDGAKYLTLIGAIYYPTDEFKMTHVGKYALSFLAEQQQREEFAKHDVSLPKPE